MIPVVAAVLVAAVFIVTSLHTPAQATSAWAAGSSFSQIDWRDLVRNFDVFVSDTVYNNPLWSLRYEVIFSILLPLYVVLAVVSRRRPWIAGLATLIASGAGIFFGDPYLFYLPIFLFGTVLAVHLPRVRELLERIASAPRRNLVGAALLLAGVALLEARWFINPFLADVPVALSATRLFSALGAAIIVAVAVMWMPFAGLLETRVVQWLGRISFSLYLVHVPIIVACSWWFRGLPWWVGSLCGIAIAIPVALLFARFVEQPSHRLSQRVGRGVQTRLRAYEAALPDSSQSGT